MRGGPLGSALISSSSTVWPSTRSTSTSVVFPMVTQSSATWCMGLIPPWMATRCSVAHPFRCSMASWKRGPLWTTSTTGSRPR